MALFVLVVVGMSGCFTGERPTLAHEPTTSPAVDAVIDRVSSLGDAVYTADYDVVTAFDGQTTPARASQSGPSRRSLTIGDVRYIVDGSSTRTCTVSTGQCVDTIDASRVSDVQMNPDFFGTSLTARIRHDAEVAVGEPTASTEDVLGQTATCTAIPVAGRAVPRITCDEHLLRARQRRARPPRRRRRRRDDDRLRTRRRRRAVHAKRRLIRVPNRAECGRTPCGALPHSGACALGSDGHE